MNNKKGGLNCKKPQKPNNKKTTNFYLGWKQHTGTDNQDNEAGGSKTEHTK